MRNPLPGRFVWTKAGGEAGQQLPDIFRRKNFERRTGRGKHSDTFWWGIGESRVEAVRHLGSDPKAVFSKVRTTANEDLFPPGVMLWENFQQNGEVCDIPAHVVITSKRTERGWHCALVCRSVMPIEDSGVGFSEINEKELRNIGRDGKVGGSGGRTTRVVERDSTYGAGRPKSHAVVGLVELVYPYCVKLVNGRKLTLKERNTLQGVSRAGTPIKEWRDAIAGIRNSR